MECRRDYVPWKFALLIQGLFVIAFLIAWIALPELRQDTIQADVLGAAKSEVVKLQEQLPAMAVPLFNDPDVVSDEELAAVLAKVLPRFERVHLRPNYVEHALRIWGSEIEFTRPELISGPEMVRFLTDTGKYVESWKEDAPPILQPTRTGIAIRWGPDRTASVHHDHLVTCLTEAGVSLDAEVYLPGHRGHVRDLVQEALRDFRVDEREVEWSVMAFGLWLAPSHISQWVTADGRYVTFDLLAGRLMRSHAKHGVCLGTHRVYTLALLLQLQDRFDADLLSPQTKQSVEEYLMQVSQLIQETPNSDGSWPPNWTDGTQADVRYDATQPFYRRVISTGHHLEWLAIAPTKFHPPRARIREAAAWAVRDVQEQSQEFIDNNYTYYSHVGNALALWRGTTPAEFWERWRQEHPDCEAHAAGPETVSALDSTVATEENKIQPNGE